jgi:hypothetical protein
MKRRSTVLTLSAMFLCSACSAPKDQSIIVSVARAPGLACDFSDSTKYVEGGAVDLAVFGAATSYYQVFSWENDLQDISVTVNGSQLTTDTPNTFIASAIRDSYLFVGGTNPPTSFVNISASIAPGGTPILNSVGVQLLTQEAALAICGLPVGTDNCPNVAALPPLGAGTTHNLLVTFTIAGNLVGGGSAQTNAITYPLSLFNSGTFDGTTEQCVAGTIPQVTSCGVPGRDIPYCIPPP